MKFETLETEMKLQITNLYICTEDGSMSYKLAIDKANELNLTISMVRKIDDNQTISTHQYGKLHDMVTKCIELLKERSGKLSYSELLKKYNKLEKKYEDATYNLNYERENRAMVIKSAKEYIEDRIKMCKEELDMPVTKEIIDAKIASYDICKRQIIMMK